MPERVRPGLDRILSAWPRKLNDARVGLLSHPASVNRQYIHAADLLIKSKKFRLSALFGPQHGIRGETQDNMIEWEGFRDPRLELPVYSLYGRKRRPDEKMLKGLDVIVIDLQDIGARYYTFIWTMSLVMDACQEAGMPVVILDRPNPLGGNLTEGPVLDVAYSSFVGLHPLPVRHGMTIAEIAAYIQETYYPKLSLHIIPMIGWNRRMWFDETRLPWVLPSPNMPTLDTATVYPGMCLIEGTTISEGRGTTRPFELFGAPYIIPDDLVKNLSFYRLPGVISRPAYFLPTFQKHAGVLCGGAQIHITDRKLFRPFKTAVAVLKSIHDLYPDDFAWKQPPYEYEEKILPIDILAGTDRLRKNIEEGVSLKDMESWWNSQLFDFNRQFRKSYLLY